MVLWQVGVGSFAALTVLVVAGTVLARLRRRLVTITVDGPSMQPTYADGDRLLARRVAGAAVRRGQVVLIAPLRVGCGPARGAGRLWVLKRVAAVPGDPVPPDLGPALVDLAGSPVPAGRLVLLGDNPDHSHDSRQEGLISADRVRGRVLWRISTGGETRVRFEESGSWKEVGR